MPPIRRSTAIQDMVSTLKNVDDIRGIFKVSIITFGGDQVTVQQELTDVKDIELHELTAAGRTPGRSSWTISG